MSTILPFKNIETKHDVRRGKDYMKKFYEYILKRPCNGDNFFFLKNEVANKRAARIIQKCKNLLYF